MKSRIFLMALCGLLTGCNLPPLTSEQIYGPGPVVDAAFARDFREPDEPREPNEPEGGEPRTVVDAPVPDAAPDRVVSDGPVVADATQERPAQGLPCGAACPAGERCHLGLGRCLPASALGSLSGNTRDGCRGGLLDGVRVRYDGVATCSVLNGKGAFILRDVQVGMKMRLSAAKPNWQLVGPPIDVVVQPFGSTVDVTLIPTAGCDAGARPEPDGGSCVCDTPECNPS